MTRIVRLIGALLFALGLSNAAVWYIWDKNHMPIVGLSSLCAGVILYLVAEFEEEL